ncbi:hypothetical protein E2C01_084637 [Portunus trituberculatus]|uniref:Uncharacterized protein n=1 Tax=Portunus trituberculatus TaxID=210409 RepID=A0A5B7J5D3_PORTR|nr:hypothetical protein [Portunus trituberculatus]
MGEGGGKGEKGPEAPQFRIPLSSAIRRRAPCLPSQASGSEMAASWVCCIGPVHPLAPHPLCSRITISLFYSPTGTGVCLAKHMNPETKRHCL